MPAARTFDAWRSQAPGAFSFALKFSRYGSHLKRLRAPRGSIATFLERAKRLEDRLGPILVQLPPRWGANRERLAAFLAAAPREQPWAIEFRDPSWLCEPIYEVLREHNVALCIHDLIRDHPLELTADWVYLRFHGIRYGGSYAPRVLQAHARRIREWLRQGRDVFAYFNNDAHGHAVSNALDLRRFVEGR